MRTPAKADRWRYKSTPISIALAGQAFDVHRMAGNWESHYGARRRGLPFNMNHRVIGELPFLSCWFSLLLLLGVKKRAERHREAVTRSEQLT